MKEHESGYTWLTRQLEKIFPFKEEYFYYGDDDPATPAQVAECVIMAIIITAGITGVVGIFINFCI